MSTNANPIVNANLLDGFGNPIGSVSGALNTGTTNGALEAGGNLAALEANSVFQNQVIDLLTAVLAQLFYSNQLAAQNSNSAPDIPDVTGITGT